MGTSYQPREQNDGPAAYLTDGPDGDNVAPRLRQPDGPEAYPTYYERPVLKPSVWSIDIPLYYFLGGTAGASMTLGAALQLFERPGGRRLRPISRICHWTGIIGSTAGAAFLIHDLGRPSRFLYMMRVFRPTSPMNMGSWILAVAAPASIATGLLLDRPGFAGLIGEASGYISGLVGAALAGYTGVLVSNTAVPLFYASRRWMPVLFMASSASAAAAMVDIFSGPDVTRTVTRVFGTAGRLTEIAAAHQVEAAASNVPRVGRPFHTGISGILWKASTIMTAASLVLSLLPGKSRRTARAAGVLGAAGSLCLRFAVHTLDKASARDPRASFEQQRSTGGEPRRAAASLQ